MAEPSHRLRNDTFETGKAAALMKSLGNPTRFLVLNYLSQVPELSVGELTRRIGISQSALSQHLARLRAHGLVASRKQAQRVLYRLENEGVRRLLWVLRKP